MGDRGSPVRDVHLLGAHTLFCQNFENKHEIENFGSGVLLRARDSLPLIHQLTFTIALYEKIA